MRSRLELYLQVRNPTEASQGDNCAVTPAQTSRERRNHPNDQVTPRLDCRLPFSLGAHPSQVSKHAFEVRRQPTLLDQCGRKGTAPDNLPPRFACNALNFGLRER